MRPARGDAEGSLIKLDGADRGLVGRTTYGSTLLDNIVLHSYVCLR
jgi:hypothetical protein